MSETQQEKKKAMNLYGTKTCWLQRYKAGAKPVRLLLVLYYRAHNLHVPHIFNRTQTYMRIQRVRVDITIDYSDSCRESKRKNNL